MRESDNINQINENGVQRKVVYPAPVELVLQRLKLRRLFPETRLERYPFETLFNRFLQEVKTLEAEHDVVNGVSREYINMSRLFPVYQKVFREEALVLGTIRYRISRIGEGEFPDDFISLNESRDRAGLWEPKYFVNRLNKKLLMRIYLPHFYTEAEEIVKQTTYLEDQVRFLKELYGVEATEDEV